MTGIFKWNRVSYNRKYQDTLFISKSKCSFVKFLFWLHICKYVIVLSYISQWVMSKNLKACSILFTEINHLNKYLPNSVAKVIVLRGNITHLCVSPCTVLKFVPKWIKIPRNEAILMYLIFNKSKDINSTKWNNNLFYWCIEITT